MSDVATGDVDRLIGESINRAVRIEQALGHLAKAVELGLVDIALDPTELSGHRRSQLIKLGQTLYELSGISIELTEDISTTLGVAIDGRPSELHKPTAIVQQPKIAGIPSGAPKSTTEQNDRLAVGELFKERTPGDTPDASPGVQDDNAEVSRTVSDLYRRIVDLSKLPEMRVPESGEAIEIRICGANKMFIRRYGIELSPHELFLFNAMILLRDQPRMGSEIKALGFYPWSNNVDTTNSTFSANMKTLLEKLNLAAGKEVIKKLGKSRNTQYAFNPRVVFSEERTEFDEVEAFVSDKRVKKK